ncbi:hypothetical protein Tco_0590406 [Tanacetum coccineum]
MVNWHFPRDDPMFTMIKVVSRHEDTQLYGAILPDALTNEAIKDSESYKEYYAIALGAEPPKTKSSVKKKQIGSDKTKTPPTTKGKRLKTSAKKQYRVFPGRYVPTRLEMEYRVTNDDWSLNMTRMRL